MEGSEDVSQVHIWRKNIPGRGAASAKSLSLILVFRKHQGGQGGYSGVLRGEKSR